MACQDELCQCGPDCCCGGECRCGFPASKLARQAAARFLEASDRPREVDQIGRRTKDRVRESTGWSGGGQ